jgi:hypothetical protein
MLSELVENPSTAQSIVSLFRSDAELNMQKTSDNASGTESSLTFGSSKYFVIWRSPCSLCGVTERQVLYF